MSESSELIRELVAGGANYADIGRALGRDRSLVRQVATGAKPGHNLRDALAGLRDRLAGIPGATVPEAPRRTTTEGRPARVRHRATWEGRKASTAVVKRQGSRAGAKSLGRQLTKAGGSGRQVAATATFGKGVHIEGGSGSKRTGGRSVDIHLGDADTVAAAVAASGGTMAEYVTGQMAERGYISGADNPAAHLDSLELRTWLPED